MANKTQCEACGKDATVHLTQIVNNKIHKVDLCEACASKMGVAEPGSASLQNLLKKNLFQNTGVELNEAEEAEACPSCGFTLRSFRKAGRFGCPSCYGAFRGTIDPVLGQMHRGDRHVGKVPDSSLHEHRQNDTVATLQAELDNAIGEEDYERAAQLRDLIENVRAAAG